MQCRVRIWRFGRGRMSPVLGCDGAVPPPVEVGDDRRIVLLDRQRRMAPVRDMEGYWYEVSECEGDPESILQALDPILPSLLERERDALRLVKELASRLEEIELIYTITETLGRTVRLQDAAQKIVEDVSQVVGAERGSILVHDEASGLLRAVAWIGRELAQFAPVRVDDQCSVAASVFREMKTISHDPRDPNAVSPGCPTGRGYRGTAFLSVPIIYTDRDGSRRPVGVINLTDRAGTDAFSGGERRLVQAIASQIAVAIENARLVERDVEQERLRQEIQLAHDLQLKLLPSPTVLGDTVDAAARCEPARGVGGDFYNFLKLQHGRLGVMLGDVSSHGFSSALIMALVLSAAGIHAGEAASPDAALRTLLGSIAKELTETEMHLALFYCVLDSEGGTLKYANAGHPHAFRVTADGRSDRLAATCPPLGLADAGGISAAETEWRTGSDLLVLFTDGITEAMAQGGAMFGESGVLDIVRQHREAPSQVIVDAVVEAVTGFAGTASDDRTILVLRA